MMDTVISTAFYLAQSDARHETIFAKEKIYEDFDDVWQASVGTHPEDPRYYRVLQDVERIRTFFNYTFFNTYSMSHPQVPELAIWDYNPDSGLLILEVLGVFDV